ncbi:hypothetical protein Tco_0207001 [Tanacetum coccineum]
MVQMMIKNPPLRSGKEPASTSAPSETTTKTAGKTTSTGSKTHKKSASQSAPVEETMQTTDVFEAPAHQEFETGVHDEQAEEEVQHLPDHYKHLDWITVRRDDDVLYKFKEGDFHRLRIQDIKDMLLLSFCMEKCIKNLNVEERIAFMSPKNVYKERCHPEGVAKIFQLGVRKGSDKDYELNLSMYRKTAKLEKQMNAKLAWIHEKYNHRSETRIGGSSSQTHEIGDVYVTAEELHQLHLDEEALRETLEEQIMDEKARE